ncbi:FtsK/SpoIIIE domain-containing protein [Ornithinimicrobium faecis]|uniref:FtsK/SpoIIIE domain-containing protein n=1 Tax=Ornithinimicrobium faecis TaxID=2934158 RepID=UPI002119775A|nr:FtsK/SpoIIIE domain-containing protein [Ornithinimicrobium sp. HY1745]
MELRISVGDRRHVRTVGVRARAGAPWGPVATTLGLHTDMVAEGSGQALLLTDEAVLGDPPLIHGVTLRPKIAGEVSDSTWAPVAVWVIGGPDAGGAFPLRTGGRLTIGRGSWCDVMIDDPGLSRHHLTLSTTRHGILIEDGMSTNGTLLDESLVEEPTIWTPGVPLRAGASTLALVPTVATLPRSAADGQGRLVVAPRHQVPPSIAPVELDHPVRATPTAPVAPGALGWLIPLGVSVLLAVVLSMPALLLFGLMAPAMALGSHVGERRRYRRECLASEETHRRALAAVQDVGRHAVAVELRARHERAPDLARLIQDAHQAGPLLWSRPSDNLICRLGAGKQSTTVTIGGVPEVAPLVPIEIDLRHGLSLVGSAAQTRALARSVLLQLAMLHAPSELSLDLATPSCAGAFAASRAHWDWMAWLPHASPGLHSRAQIQVHDLIDTTEPSDIIPQARPTDADTGTGHRAFGSLTEAELHEPKVIPIVLCHNESQAAESSIVVAVNGPTLQVSTSSGPLTCTPDLLSAVRTHRTARLLAPLSDGSRDDGPGSVPLRVDLTTIVPPISADALADHWRAEPRSTRFALGQDATSTVALDLAADGPHALVAGTTGSGKSELLRTLVTSLALVNRPDELVMVLVDYKGGSAFAEAAALPHVVGVITDLDPHLADRALTSLTAELKRREHILADAGVPDLPAYQALNPREPMPRLVLVIDEFRALAEELPDFLDGLVRIAALGRSLGVHLVLATQRPGGVVSADVRANVNLRIALRVRDGSDSYDVIDSQAAADLPEGVPGRALIRTGADAPRTVQVASSSTPAATASADDAESVSIIPVHDLWSPDRHPTPDEPEDDGTSTLARATAATTQAATAVGATPPPSPWLPALPEFVPLADLPADGEPAGWGGLPLMLTDLPAQQLQPVHCWHPLVDGHLGLAGAARSGRSTVARSILAGLLARPPGDAHIYAFDLAGSLGTLFQAPQVGAVLAAPDVVRGCRVIAHLARVVTERQQALAADGYTSLAEQRASATHPWPLVVLVIDGWARFTEIYGESERGRPLEQVLQILREGLAVGVVAVVTGDRSLLAGRIAPLLGEMWSLRLTDPADLLMAGLTRSQVPGRMPPGRAVRLRDAVVGQVAVVGSAADGSEQVATLSQMVARVSPVPPGTGPTVFRALPRTVDLDTVDPAGAAGLVLGVGGDAAEPCELPLPATGVGALGIVGPPGSGRTTTLHTLEHAARSRGWSVVVLDEALIRDTTALERQLQESQDGTLVTVDGFESLSTNGVEDVLLSWLDSPRSHEHPRERLVAVTGEPEDLGGFRGLAARVARGRTGVILQPESAADGAGFGVAVPTGDERLPGRGVLVARGACTAIQVARPGH